MLPTGQRYAHGGQGGQGGQGRLDRVARVTLSGYLGWSGWFWWSAFDIFLFYIFPKKIMTLGFGLHFLCSSYSFTSNEISGPTFVFLTFSIL